MSIVNKAGDTYGLGEVLHVQEAHEDVHKLLVTYLDVEGVSTLNHG